MEMLLFYLFLYVSTTISGIRPDAGIKNEEEKEEVTGKGNYKVQDGVLVLTTGNFQSALEEYEHILVEFYAPWCGHCKNLAPEYAQAAKDLAAAGSSIKLAKVDATEESSLAEQFGVRGYPTLKFFKSGKPIEYNGGRQAENIVSWLKKKTGPPAKTIETVEHLEVLLQNNTVAIVGYFKDSNSEGAKVFLSVADEIDDHVFGIVTDENVAKDYFENDGEIMLFKQFDDNKVKYQHEDGIVDKHLKSFIYTRSLPLVVEFNHDTATKIFGGNIKSHLLLFLSKKAGHYDEHIENARKIANQFLGKILFVSINADEEDHGRILEYFGMKNEEMPVMRAIKLEDDMSKFKPTSSDLTYDTILNFVSDFIDGKLKQDYLSQALPEDWDSKPVKVLVASNFKEIALDEKKDVLVEFYAPWCGHCKQLIPIYDQLAENLKDKDDIVIAKLDATANELEDVKITSFPTITLYPKGDKSKVIEYTGERTLEALTKFIESGGKYPATPEKEEEEEEEGEKPEKKAKDEL